MALSILTCLLAIPVVFSTGEQIVHDKVAEELFYHTGTCNTEHNRDIKKDKNYYTSNSDVPHDPSSSGFMATHGTYRFLAVHQQVGLMLGEGKHGMWRVHENGFVRVYRRKGKEGIPGTEKEVVQEDGKTNLTLFNILGKDYQSLGYHEDSNAKFEHVFGDETSDEKWLNWIDLPIYHPKFNNNYANHVAIDLPFYFCQLSSRNFPHIGNTWNLMKIQPNANKVGPLGERAGLDIRENVKHIVRFNHFKDAGVWANIGQGKNATDFMPNNTEELKGRVQTTRWTQIDLEKVKYEIYIIERAYHNDAGTYLSVALVMDQFSYIRPDGLYYKGLTDRNVTIINTKPHYRPKIFVENETEEKEVFGLATFGHHHMNRLRRNLEGGGCPTKGGDISGYPWGDVGSGWPVNYEEVTPICDGFLVDLKFWTNLDKDWDKESMFLGNAGIGFSESKSVTYYAQANHYGKFKDDYNINKGIKNPYELDLTEDGKIQEKPKNLSAVPVVNFTIEFSTSGEATVFNIEAIDLSPRTCGSTTFMPNWMLIYLVSYFFVWYYC